MAAETTRKRPEIDADIDLRRGMSAGRAVSDDRDVLDLTDLHLREAPEAQYVAGLLEVDVPRPSEPTVEAPSAVMAARFVGLALIGLLAPLAVLVVAVSLPVASALQGAVLVAGWTVLGTTGHRFVTRRRR